MALWDFFGSQAGQQGLMGFGASMLANSGWKPVNSPGTTFGEILGQGMQAGMQGYQQGQAQHEREVELGYQKRQRAEQDRLARDQRLNDLAKQQEQIAARDLAIKQLGGRIDPAQASLLRAQDPAQAGASLLEYLSPQAVDPVKLGQGEALVDPRTGQMIASGLPEDRKPIQVGSTLLDPFTFQPLYQAPAEGMSQYQQAQLELERQKLAKGEGPTSLVQNLIAAGLQPGTSEFRDAVIRAETKPLVGGDSGPKLPAGYQWADPNNPGAGVKPLAGGPADPSNPTNISEGQRKGIALGERGQRAMDNIRSMLGSGYDPISKKSVAMDALSSLPMVGDVASAFKPEQQKQFDQSYQDVANALNRLESGASITPMDTAAFNAAYKPAAGDTPAVINQKLGSLDAYIKQLIQLSGNHPATPQSATFEAAPAGGADNDPLGIR